MTRSDLLQSAKKIEQVSEDTINEYSLKRDMLVTLINDKMLSRSDITDMIGANNVDMMKDNHANHARFLESVFAKYNPEVLVDTVIWVFRAYRSRNFRSTYWAAQLNTWIDIYKNNLTEKSFHEVYPYYNWMQINIPLFNSLAEEELDTPLSSH